MSLDMQALHEIYGDNHACTFTIELLEVIGDTLVMSWGKLWIKYTYFQPQPRFFFGFFILFLYLFCLLNNILLPRDRNATIITPSHPNPSLKWGVYEKGRGSDERMLGDNIQRNARGCHQRYQGVFNHYCNTCPFELL